jgi:serine/threonine-protein kinase
MIGSTVQKYRIVRELGSGAMGAVYEAVDTLTERPVAMKVLRAELARQPELIDRFRSEAVTLARLNHPNIAILYDFFLEKEDYYMAMEFVRGQPLESVIRSSGCLDPKMAARVMSQVLDGLAHAHSMGVLHRDIKPANIMVTSDGRVKVTDFGIARVLGSSRMTRTGRIIGTLEYIAPERIRGDESDPRSDLYSAGVVLYEMLTGKLPFTAQTDFALIKAHLEEDPPPLAGMLGADSAADWDFVVRKAMAKSAQERFQTAEEFRHGLPSYAMAPQGSGSSPGMYLKPTRLAGTASPETNFEAKQQPGPGTAAWQAGSVSEPVRVPQKLPPMALILGAAAVLATVLLIVVVVLRVRANNSVSGGTSPSPDAVATPGPQSPPMDAPKQDDASGASQQIGPAPAIPVTNSDPNLGKSSVIGRKSAPDDRRGAALRALDTKDATGKNSKRSAALKALDQ